MNATDHSARGLPRHIGSTLRVFLALAALGSTIAASGCVEPTPLESEVDGDEDEIVEAQQALGTNVALGRPTTQSTTYTGSGQYPASSRAVDGNTNGNFAAGSVTSTNHDAQAWWQVDLQTVRAVGTVVVWNRTDCCSNRLSNYYVRVSEDGVNWHSYYELGVSPQHRSFTVNRRVRFVKVQLAGANYLSLAEVQVFELTNLALGKSTSQSSTYMGSSSSRAVDGNTNGNSGAGSVTHTNDDFQAWWQVNLGSSKNVGDVKLYNRTDCCTERLKDFDLAVSDDGYTWQLFPHPGAAPSELWFSVGRTARYIKVQLKGTDYLSLAEVQVFPPN